MKSHIYYEIDGAERGKGFGNEILRLGLEEAAKEGLKEVVVTVESDNIPSKKIIEKNGGVFAESFDLKNGSKQLKYIFDLKRQ